MSSFFFSLGMSLQHTRTAELNRESDDKEEMLRESQHKARHRKVELDMRENFLTATTKR